TAGRSGTEFFVPVIAARPTNNGTRPLPRYGHGTHLAADGFLKCSRAMLERKCKASTKNYEKPTSRWMVQTARARYGRDHEDEARTAGPQARPDSPAKRTRTKAAPLVAAMGTFEGAPRAINAETRGRRRQRPARARGRCDRRLGHANA